MSQSNSSYDKISSDSLEEQEKDFNRNSPVNTSYQQFGPNKDLEKKLQWEDKKQYHFYRKQSSFSQSQQSQMEIQKPQINQHGIDQIEERIKLLEKQLERRITSINKTENLKEDSKKNDNKQEKEQKQKKKEEFKIKNQLIVKKINENIIDTKPKLFKESKQLQQQTKELKKSDKINNKIKKNKTEGKCKKCLQYQHQLNSLKQNLDNKEKKRSNREVQKLKQLIGKKNTLKLDKEIELLQIIQSIHQKLKKSISRKLSSRLK